MPARPVKHAEADPGYGGFFLAVRNGTLVQTAISLEEPYLHEQ